MDITEFFPLIDSISGRFGNKVRYNRNNKPCVRTYVKPRNPNTLCQRINRHRFTDAVKSWQELNQEDKDKYNRKARYLNMSGYNLYISIYMKADKYLKPGINTWKTFMNPGISQREQRRFHSVSPPVLFKATSLQHKECFPAAISSLFFIE